MGPSGPVFTWTPLSLIGLEGWYDFGEADSLTISDGDKIDQIDDLSGNGNHLSQAISGGRPSWAGGVATFPGDSQRLESASALFSGTAHRLVFAVVEQLAAEAYTIYVNGWCIVDSGTAGAAFQLGFFGTDRASPGKLGWNGQARLIEANEATRVDDGAYHIQGIYDESPTVPNNYQFSLDGIHPTTTNVYQGAASASTSATPFKLKGPSRIKEAIVCGLFDAAEYEPEKIEGYLAWKHGLEDNLPMGHLYKNSPP